MKNKVVLCVEDNISVQMINKPLLEGKGFTVNLAMTLHEAREELRREMPGLIILDIHLPDGNGLDFLRELRKTSAVPVIALTNNKKEQDIVEGLSSGCDAYIPKPYTFPVLYAHIETVLRRAGQVPEVITKGILTLNPVAVQAFISGSDLLLQPKEFSLLLLFAQNEGETMSAEYIYEKVWKAPLVEGRNSLEKAVSRLRKSIALSGYDITTRRGQGYIFSPKEIFRREP